MRRILIVDDNQPFSRELSRSLSQEGFSCDAEFDGQAGLKMALEIPYDLVILDVLLPGISGYQVCSKVRERDLLVPILMLTAKSGEWDEAEGLDTGADDYLVKPVSMVVLKAHVHALIRRSRLLPLPTVSCSGLTLDRSLRTCCSGEVVVNLTGREVEVLAHLFLAQGAPVSKEQLVDSIWGSGTGKEIDPNVIVVYVKRLREKFEASLDRKVIETVHGVGYRVEWS